MLIKENSATIMQSSGMPNFTNTFLREDMDFGNGSKTRGSVKMTYGIFISVIKQVVSVIKTISFLPSRCLAYRVTYKMARKIRLSPNSNESGLTTVA
jgi:hypothetical protein